MKHLHYLLLILFSIVSYPMENITPEQQAAFEKKYSFLTDIYNSEKKCIDNANKELEQNKAYTLQQVQKLRNTVNERIIFKVKKTENGVKLMASALPGFTVASAFATTYLPEKLKKGTPLLLLAVMGLIQSQRENDPEFLSAAVSGCGMTAYLDINMILGFIGKHIYAHGSTASKDNFLLMATSIGGLSLAYCVEKTESNGAINIPFTNYIALRDNQIVGIGCRTLGNLLAENKKPTHDEILYELLKNTAGELSYSALAQTAPHCLDNVLPTNCNPNTLLQRMIKTAIVEGAAYLICAIAPVIANSIVIRNIANQATSIITSCMQPLLPM